jgi:hypothetical protein
VWVASLPPHPRPGTGLERATGFGSTRGDVDDECGSWQQTSGRALIEHDDFGLPAGKRFHPPSATGDMSHQDSARLIPLQLPGGQGKQRVQLR